MDNIENQPQGAKPPSQPLKEPLQPLDLKKTGLPPLALVGFVFLGFVAAAVLFAYFSKSAQPKVAPAQVPAAPVTIMEVVPAPVTETAPENIPAEDRPVPVLTLSGILFGPEGSLALINGRIVREGGMVDGAKLEKISSDRVELSFDGQKVILRSK